MLTGDAICCPIVDISVNSEASAKALPWQRFPWVFFPTWRSLDIRLPHTVTTNMEAPSVSDKSYSVCLHNLTHHIHLISAQHLCGNYRSICAAWKGLFYTKKKHGCQFYWFFCLLQSSLLIVPLVIKLLGIVLFYWKDGHSWKQEA